MMLHPWVEIPSLSPVMTDLIVNSLIIFWVETVKIHMCITSRIIVI